MTFAGKLVGGLLGFLVHPYIGTAIGLWIGHQFDKAVHLAWHPLHFIQKSFTASAQHAFSDAMFSVMGHIAKADGHISQREIELAETWMTRMRLSPQQRQEAIRQFNLGKEAHFDLQKTLHALLHSSGGNIVLLRLFIELQIQAASVDGFNAEKQRLLQRIAQQLGANMFSSTGFEQAGFDYNNQQRSAHNPAQTANPYQVLNIKTDASNNEVKQAYRRLMSQNHPDKLASQGLTEEMIKLATEKTQAIQAAYEQIRQQRGMK